jgi:hypothetical protein
VEPSRPTRPLALDIPQVRLDPGIRYEMATDLPLLIARQVLEPGSDLLGHLLE